MCQSVVQEATPGVLDARFASPPASIGDSLAQPPCAGIGGHRAARHATRSGSGRQRYVVFAEYMLVTALIVLAVGLALYGLGVPLVQAFFLTKLFILLPFP